MKNFFKKRISKLTDLKGLASIGIGDIVGSGITAVFWFFIASELESEAYGEIHYLIGIAGVAQIVSLIGNSNVMTVYTAKNINIVSTLTIISLIIGAISSLTILILFFRIDVSFLVLAYIMIQLSNGILLGRKLFKKYLKFILIQKGLTLVLGIGFYFTFGEIGIIYALVLSHVHYIFIIVKELKNQKIVWSQLNQKKNFIINNYSLGLSGSISGQIDKIIIAPILGFQLLGNYALALQFIAIITILPTIVYKYILPQDSTGIQNKNLKKGIIIISIVIAVLASILLPYVIPVFFPQYIMTIDAIQIMSYSVVPATITLVYTSKFLATEMSKNVLIGKITSTGILILGFIFIAPILGIIGLSIIFVVSSSTEALLLVLMDRFGRKNQ